MPDVTIDPTLSVYSLALRSTTQRALPRHRRVMLILSHEIEYVVIKGGSRARVFAGFQRMSNFLPQAQRYEQLAQAAESVYVFGVMDVEPPSIANVQYIPLNESDQLANEWFVVADAPDFFSAFVGNQIANPAADETPSFEAIWTFDEDLVTILQEQLTDAVYAFSMGDLASIRDRQRNLGILTNSMFRLTSRLIGAIGSFTPEIERMVKDVSLVVQEEIGPSIKTMADDLKRQMQPPAADDSTPAASA